MKKLVMAAAAACFAMAGAANAGTISVSAFDIASFNTATQNGSSFTIQDFEAIGAASAGPAQLPGPLETNVGKFSALSGQGSGAVCGASGGDCTELFLNNKTNSGQGNMVPDNGVWSLNANDTFGIQWDVVRKVGNTLVNFNRIVFAMMDPADQGATVTVTTGSDEVEFSNLLNANQQLIVIDFANMVDIASVRIASTRTNDSFSIDGASVGVVPLPAGGLLLLSGFGLLALRRRREVAKAA